MSGFEGLRIPFRDVSADREEGAGTGASIALALLRILADSVFLMDPDGRVTYINRAGLEDMPARSAARGQFWWELWSGTGAERLQAALNAALDGEEVDLILDLPRFTDGVERGFRTCKVTVVPVEDIGGQVTKVLGVVRAI